MSPVEHTLPQYQLAFEQDVPVPVSDGLVGYLVALDGKKVDPFHLQLYKDGTIVLVPPANTLNLGGYGGAIGGYTGPVPVPVPFAEPIPPPRVPRATPWSLGSSRTGAAPPISSSTRGRSSWRRGTSRPKTSSR